MTADTVTTSPVTAFGTVNCGDVELVMLSVFDVPESVTPRRSGMPAVGAMLSIVIDNGALLGDTFPAASVRVEDTFHCPGVNVGRSHDVAGDV